MNLKADTSIISVIIIAGILIALTGATYIWGVPLIEKRTAISDFTSAENFVTELNGKIIDIANSGSGQAILDVPLGGLRVVPPAQPPEKVPDNNSVILELFVKQPMLMDQDVVYLGGSVSDALTEVGTYGVSEPSVITAKMEPSGSGYVLSIKTHYRELSAATKAYKILLNDQGVGVSGTDKIRISYSGSEVRSGQASNGGDLIVTLISLEPS